MIKVKPKPTPKVLPVLSLEDAHLLQIGKQLRDLCHAKNGGLQLHVWHTPQGFQVNVKYKNDKGWGVTIRRSLLEALQVGLRR